MKDYYDLEKTVISCLFEEPKLMERLELEDKHFIRYQRLWVFMKSFYKKFKTFDMELMKSVCQRNKRSELVNYICKTFDNDGHYVRFDLYQRQLKELYEEKVEEKIIIEKIFELANDLYVKNIDLKKFFEEISKYTRNSLN